MRNSKEHWVTIDGKQFGFILNYNNRTDTDEKVYVTDRKTRFKLGDEEGFSISDKVFKKYLLPLGVSEIRIREVINSIPINVFITTVDNWKKHGKTNFYGLSDRQLFLPIEGFEIRGK